jgi:HEAT repeat protein
MIDRDTEETVMDLKAYLDTPPWDWPRDAGKTFWRILADRRASESDRLVAAELAGDFTVINNDLADVLLTIAGSTDEPEQLRARAAISLGPILEQADTDGFDDPDDVPITEGTFHNIQDTLEKVYNDKSTPKEVRRRILEASVRAPQTWHQDAIWHAYSSGDKEWMLTAVFSMRWVRGFDDQILQALKSEDPEINYQAVIAAGNWELDGAWPHIVELVNDAHSSKPLLLAAIGALSGIRPAEARDILEDLAESDDEEIAEAVTEAMAAAEEPIGEEDDEEDGGVN